MKKLLVTVLALMMALMRTGSALAEVNEGSIQSLEEKYDVEIQIPDAQRASRFCWK